MKSVSRPPFSVPRVPRLGPPAARRLAALLCTVVAMAACGKKGPPLPPLHLVPGPVTELTVRRTGTEVELRFALPTTNANGPGRVELDRVEVYAVTVAPGSVTPPNRDLLTKTYVVGTIPVKPLPIEGEATEPSAGAPADSRPSPGDHVSFVEQLTEERLKPAPLPKAPPAVSPAAGAAAPPAATAPGVTPAAPAPPATAPGAPPPAPAAAPAATPLPAVPPATGAPPATAPLPTTGAPPAAAAPATAAAAPGAVPAQPASPPPTYVVRIYALRGLTRSGRPGQPASRVTVPLVPAPAAPGAATASFSEKGITLGWTAPAAVEGAPPPAFNVYRVGNEATPVNPAPLAAAALELPVQDLGTEQCFVVRSVAVVAAVRIESDPSAKTCVTPRDTFPPAAPKEVSLLVLEGGIEVVWDAAVEPDLAGYIVLRGTAPGDTLQPLTPTPTRETTFRDATVKPGARYVYAVVAVDRAGNASAQSARVEGIAR